jgi:hypothetical protein
MAPPYVYSLITNAPAPIERAPLTPRRRVIDPIFGRYDKARWARCSGRAFHPAKHARFSHVYDLGHGRYNWAFLSRPYDYVEAFRRRARDLSCAGA